MPMNPRLLRPTASGFLRDADARAYIAAVEDEDGQRLEKAVAVAIQDFILGCKQDGIWSAIKASCLLAGPRTLAGALTPLVGAAPTNNGPFVSGDYNRETGLVGDGSTKYLDSNRAVNADPQDSVHQAIFFTQARGTNAYIGAGGAANGTTQIGSGPGSNIDFRCRTSSSASVLSAGTLGLVGQSRSASASFITRVGGSNATQSIASQSPISVNSLVFARNSSAGVPGLISTSRIAYYSIGESLDLALLDTRVSALIAAIGAAI